MTLAEERDQWLEANTAIIHAPRLTNRSHSEALRWAKNNAENALAKAYMAATLSLYASDPRAIEQVIIPKWQGTGQGYIGDMAYIQDAAFRHRDLLGHVILNVLGGERGYGSMAGKSPATPPAPPA